MQQQQHNKDNMLLVACWREMQDELQGVRGPCHTLQLMKELHRVQNIFCYKLLSNTCHIAWWYLCVLHLYEKIRFCKVCWSQLLLWGETFLTLWIFSWIHACRWRQIVSVGLWTCMWELKEEHPKPRGCNTTKLASAGHCGRMLA